MTTLKKKTLEKPVACRPSPLCAEWLDQNFDTVGGGAAFCLDTMRTLYGYGIAELKGVFTRHELSLILDVMNGSWITEGMIGQHISANVADCGPDGTPEKWGVDLKTLLQKLNGLNIFQKSVLEIWVKIFWEGLYEEKNSIDRWTGILL